MAPQARSDYDVRVVAIRSLRETLRSWFISTVGWLLWGVFGPEGPRVRVEIIALATGTPLAEWKCYVEEAADLKAKIERDLGEKDADVFAAEWGLISN